jgi:hypothetical protein
MLLDNIFLEDISKHKTLKNNINLFFYVFLSIAAAYNIFLDGVFAILSGFIEFCIVTFSMLVNIQIYKFIFWRNKYTLNDESSCLDNINKDINHLKEKFEASFFGESNTKGKKSFISWQSVIDMIFIHPFWGYKLKNEKLRFMYMFGSPEAVIMFLSILILFSLPMKYFYFYHSIILAIFTISIFICEKRDKNQLNNKL